MKVLSIATIFFALGCGASSPPRDISSYELDYYGYVKNRLPIMEKIVDGQCSVILGQSPLFEDEKQKTYFLEALGNCIYKIAMFRHHLNTIENAANSDNCLAKRSATLAMIRQTQKRLGVKYDICDNLQKCLRAGRTEPDTIRCLEEAAERTEKLLPRE